MLEKIFTELLTKYNASPEVIKKLWMEITDQYSGKKKYYHNLNHLEKVLQVLTEVKTEIRNWDTVMFTLFYHDIIYSAVKADNEEQSAELAQKRMQQLDIPEKMIKECKAQILATKHHLPSDDSDTNYFTDADLSVLGQDWDTYSAYFENIRKEFSFYPDMVYNAGRRKVLKHFLAMDRIFKTPYFYETYETQAKLNLFSELRTL